MALQIAIVGNSLLREVDLPAVDFVVIRTGLGMSAMVSCFLQDYSDIKNLLLHLVEK